VMSTVLEDVVHWVRTKVPATLRRMMGRGGDDDKPDQGAPKSPHTKVRDKRPAAPEHVAAMHLPLARESGKD
jgi:hypothetical protein